MKNVCVIGAGVSGIVAARYLREHFKVTILEASSFIGGVWLYDKDSQGKATPMYKNLRSNLPKQLMVFRDLEHEPGLPTFLDHYQVLSYIERYCDKFSIRDHIRFNSRVNLVKPDLSGDEVQWIVQTESGETHTYDGIAVCTGRYDNPNIPDISGIGKYRGKYIHSKEYKTPEPFQSQQVLVIGARSSAVDIVIDLHLHGAQVFVSHRKGEPLKGLPASVMQHSEPVRFDEQSVHFKDNTSGVFDMIIFATGYKTSLDFLDPRCGITVETIPRPLYKYFINPVYPTMALPDQCYQVAPFPLCEYQAIFYTEFLLGNVQLPAKKVRLREAHKIIENTEKPLKYKYALQLAQFAYYSELAKACGVPAEGELDFAALHDLYRDTSLARSSGPMLYREDQYEYDSDVGQFCKI